MKSRATVDCLAERTRERRGKKPTPSAIPSDRSGRRSIQRLVALAVCSPFAAAADVSPMDFSAWAEVFLDGRWYTIDARHNHPRIGRFVVGRGRDAADVASTTFGIAKLAGFEVITQEKA
jgi:transglutaminase-like putative cysteine protease